MPYATDNGLNPYEPMAAPSLPQAAEKPFKEDRTSCGYVSEGRINVVEFGPKLAKKKVSP